MSAFRDVVAAHHGDSDGILLAAREPCLSIAHDEIRKVKGRLFRVVIPEDLPTLSVRASWLMAVLLCPDDDTKALAAWMRRGRRDARRILFYFHPKTAPVEALRAWAEADLPVVSTWTVRSWTELHRHFGAAWNVRVFDDFRSP